MTGVTRVRIGFLGVGGWLSSPWFKQVGILLEIGGLRIVLDVGEGTYYSLAGCFNLSPEDIDYFIITHRHGDHVLGLPTLVQRAKKVDVKLRVITHGDVVKGIKELFNALGIPNYINWVEFIEVSEGMNEITKELRVSAVKAVHPLPSLSYLIEHKGFKVAYSGDTSPNDKFIHLARGCDLLIHEVSATEGQEEEALAYGHTTSPLATEVISKVRPRYFIPIHYPDTIPPLEVSQGTRVITPIPCGVAELH